MIDESLRDTFAAAALTGILANEGEGKSLSGTCRWAYRVADAMLRERSQSRPETNAWTSKPYWVDPPSGWLYGFPRLYDPSKDGNMTEWMIANGYPEYLARKGLPCTFTEDA